MYIPMILVEIITVIVFAIIIHNDQVKQEQQRKHEWELEDSRREMSKEIMKLRKQVSELQEIETNRFALVIRNEIFRVQSQGLYTDYDADDLCDMILEHGSRIGVTSIENICFVLFERTIKAAIYASEGYFDIHMSAYGEPFRFGKNRKHIPITDEEIEKLENYDFDFVYDSVSLEL